jgi:hypothetical protein
MHTGNSSRKKLIVLATAVAAVAGLAWFVQGRFSLEELVAHEHR